MPETIKVGFSNPYAKPKKSPSTISVIFSNPYDEEKEPDRETDKGNFFDSLPAVFKQAYNESLGGIMYQMMEGKKRFDLSQAPESFCLWNSIINVEHVATGSHTGLSVT